MKQYLTRLRYAFVLGLYMLPELAYASTKGPAMPWDNPLTTVRDSLTGTVAHVLITAAVVITGIFFAFTEAGTGARKIFGVALGGALSLGAISFMTAIGFAGAGL